MPLRPLLPVLATALLAPLLPVLAAPAAAAVPDVVLFERTFASTSFGERYDPAPGRAFSATEDPATGAVTVRTTREDRSEVSLVLRPPTGTRLAPGRYAVGATPTAERAGVQVQDGRERCEDPTGSLVVREVTPAGLAASYSLSCRLGTGTLRFGAGGEVRVGSDVPLTAATVPPSVALPDSGPGREAGRDVPVRNTGSAPLTVAAATLSGQDAASFRVADDTCSGRTLAPGASCRVLVGAVLDTVRTARAVLELTDDTALGLRRVELTARTVAPPRPPLTTASAGYDGVGVTVQQELGAQGEAREYRFFRVRDGAAVLVGSVPAAPGFAAHTVFADTTVAPGETATYRATVVTPGGESAPGPDVTATVPSDPVPPGGEQTGLVSDVPVRFDVGATTDVQRELTLLPENRPRRLALKVGGQGSLLVQYPAEGLRPGTYPVSDPAFGSTPVRWSLSGVVTGGCPATELTVREAALHADGRPEVLDLAWTSSSCGGGTERATGELRYQAVRGYAAADALPSTVQGGDPVVGTESAPQQVTVRNLGTVPLPVGPAAVEGSAAWRVAASTCTGTLPVAGSCTVDVVLRPTGTGSQSSLLRVGDGTALGRRTVRLVGSGRTAPGAPRSVEAVAAAGRVQVRWSPPADDGGTPVRSYRLTRSTDGGPALQIAETLSAGYDDVADAGSRYTYTVAAVNDVGPGPATTSTTGVAPARDVLASVSVGAGYRLQRVLLDSSARVDEGGPGFEQDAPSVSPDRRSVAYSALTTTGSEIVSQALSGGGTVTHTRGSEDTQPAWSPDGRTLAFVRFDGEVPVLFTVPVVGGGPAVPVPGGRGYARPSFLPDGRRVVAVRDGVRPALHVVHLDGSARTPLPGGEDGFDPAVSPDGRSIAFARLDAAPTTPDTSLRLLPVDGGTSTVLADPPGLNVWPAWTPDGAGLVFEHADSGTAASDLFTVQRDGGALANLTRTAGIDEGEPAVHDLPGAAVPPAQTRRGLTVPRGVVLPGARVEVTVTGDPGSTVELFAYSRPSTTYRLVRQAEIGPDGRVVLPVTPGTNTRLYARIGAGGAPTTTASVAVSVRTALSLSVVRRAPRDLVLQGRLLPRLGGQLVSLYRRSGGRDVLLGQTRTDGTGTWRLPRRFGSAATLDLVAKTGKTPSNEPGTSAVVRVRVP